MATAIFYAESLGDSSTSSTTPQVKLTNSVSVVSGRKYLILGSATARIGTGASARNAVVQIWDNTGSAEIALVNSSFADVNSDPAVSLGAVYTAGSTGTVDFQLRYYRGGASNTIVVGSARLLVIELGDNDESTSPSDYARSSTSYGDAATLTFTPATSGDYIFLFGGGPDNYPVGTKFLAPGGASVAEAVDGPAMRGDIASIASWGGIWVENLAASSQTAKIQFKSTDGASRTLTDIFLVALRADDLANVQYSQDTTPAGGTQNSYTNSETLAATSMDTASRDTVAIGAFSVKGSSSSVNALVQFTEGGSALIESTHRPSSPGTRDSQTALVALKSAAAGSSITYNIDRRSSTTSATTTVNYAALAVFEIEPGVSDISGAAAGTSTVAGDLNGAGELSGASAGAATATGDLNGAGRLSGTSAGSSTASGAVDGAGALAGVANGSATTQGIIAGQGALAGAAAGTSTATGALSGLSSDVSGTAAGTSTAAGALLGDGALAGAAAGTSTSDGHAEGGGALVGAAAGTAVVAGILSADGILSGAAAGSGDAQGDLGGEGLLSGAAPGASTATGIVSGAGRLSGASAGAATATGSLVADGALAGTAAGTSTASGQLLGVGALSGAAAGTSTATGSLVAILPASGTAAGTSTAAGTISGAGALIGVASGAATVSGDLNGDGDLAGTAAGTSTATGHVADAGSLRGSAHGSSAASGALSEGRTLGEILAAWGIRNGWQPPGAAVALGKLRGRAAGGSSATGKIAGLQPKTRRPRQAAPAPTARKASPARPSPARKPQIDRLIPMPGPLSGRAIGRHVVATGAVVGIGALAGTAAGAEGASVGTLKAIAEARGTGRGQGAARGAVAAIYGDTLDDEEALAMILAAA